MGFGSILGGIGKGLLGLIPGGGTISAAMDMASPILGGAAKSQSAAGMNNAQLQLQRDRLQQDKFKTDQSLPGQRLSNSVAASKVANYSPVTMNWGGPGSGLRGEIPKFSGGWANPNIIGQDTRSLAADIQHKALMDQLGGVVSPEIKGGPVKEGVGSKILGGLALGSSILGGLGRIRNPGNTMGYEPNDSNGWG